LKHAHEQADMARQTPDAVLPAPFQVGAGHVADSTLTEMKDAIVAEQERQGKIKAELELVRGRTVEKLSAEFLELTKLRDQSRKTLAALPARESELEAALAPATTDQARELARIRLSNLELEGRIATETGRKVEAKITHMKQESSHVELRQKTLTAECELAKRLIELMETRYRALAGKQQDALQRAAAREQVRAIKSNDPVEKYRAGREALFLGIQAALLKDEQELASRPSPSFQEQNDLLEREREDFEGQKKLIETGRSAALVATRLTHSYRRLASERLGLVNRELGQATFHLSRYENALTEVELDLTNQTHEHQLELETILARLPKPRHPEMMALFETLDQKHRSVLESRRRTLEKLVYRAANAREKILERIKLLDEQRAFIRTHLFWVRDAKPVGVDTVVQVPREVWGVGRAIVALAADFRPDGTQLRLSPIYVVSVLGVAGLPWFVYRARKALRGLVDAERGPRNVLVS
jgi:hypothetical protein